MKVEIKHINGTVLYTCEASSVCEAVEQACRDRAYLSGANLFGADLSGADLSGADLSGADLSRAYLSGTDLYRANLSGADLSGANLSRAYLSGANLSGANLSGTDLSRADLSGADLSGADLSGASLKDARGAELSIARTRILPEGELYGWKKCAGGVIVKLRIPEKARRSNAWGRKCRAEYAIPVEVIGAEFGVSLYDGRTRYVVGEKVECDVWKEDWTKECAGGIHFYLTREEAEAHV